MKRNYFKIVRRGVLACCLPIVAGTMMAFSPGEATNVPPHQNLAPLFFDPTDYVTFTVNGLSDDVIANGVGSLSATTTNDIDGGGYCYLAVGTQITASSTAITYGLPADGLLQNPTNADLTFQLADYDLNNSLRISTSGSAGEASVTFTETGMYESLYFAVTSGGGSATISGTINFDDNTTQAFSSVSVPDWYSGTSLPILAQGIGRGNTSNDGFENPNNNPRIYQLTLNVDIANQGKTVTGVTFQKTGGVFNMFAASGKLAADCPGPSNLALGALTTTTAEITWDGYDANDTFEYAYVAAGDPTPTTGTAVGTGTVTLSTLTANTSYDFYVRALCGGVTGYSYWTGPFTFTTACDIAAAIDEDFEGSAVPNCWTIINGGDTYTWDLYDSGTYAHSGTKSMRIRYGSTAHNDYLITPGFTVVDHTSDMLSFWCRNYSSTWMDSFDVLVSTTGTDEADFTEVLASSVTPPTSYTEYVYDLSAYEGQTVYFAIKAISTNEYYLYVDDVTTYGQPYCLVPENVTTSSVTAYEAVITWDMGTATDWEVAYVADGDPAPTTGTAVATNSYTISGLTSETAYDVYVRTNCGADGYSDWVMLDITTDIACHAPTALTLSGLYPTLVTIDWTEGATGQSAWEVAYTVDGDPAPTTGAAVTDMSYSLTGLTANTSYVFYVRADCGTVDGYSDWVSISFTTPCDAVAGIDEDFEGSDIPSCWTIINGGDNNTWSLYDYGTYAHSGTKSMRISYSSSAHDDYLITPGFTVTEHVSDVISFWAKNYSSSWIDEFNVLVSTTGTAKADFTEVLASNVAPSTSYTEYTYDLSAYEGQTIYFAIQAISTNEYYVYIDDVVTTGSEYCSAPTALSAEVLLDEASLSWDDEVSTSWEIVIQDAGTGEPTTAGTVVTDDSYDYTLSYGDVKEFYVRSVCDGGGNSPWAGPYAFGGYLQLEIASGLSDDVIANGVGSATTSTTNDVDGANYAYISKDFKVNATDADLSYGLPVSGIVSSPNTSGLNYQLADYDDNNSLRMETAATGGTLTFTSIYPAEKVYLLTVSGSGEGFVSGTINFTDGSTQTIASTSVPNWFNSTSLPVAISGIGRINLTNDNLENPSGNPRIYELEITIDAINESKTISSIDLMKDSGGVINVFAVSMKYSSYALSTPTVAENVIAVYPNPVKNKLFVQGVDATSVAVYNMLGQKMNATLANNSIDMSNLETGVYLVTIYSNNGAKTMRVVKK